MEARLQQVPQQVVKAATWMSEFFVCFVLLVFCFEWVVNMFVSANFIDASVVRIMAFTFVLVFLTRLA